MKFTPHSFLTAVITGAILATGCTTYDAYTGEEKVSSTAKGAGIGAGVGAVLGYITARDKSSKDRKKAMLAGAGIGAVAGGGVGYYMDAQEAKLRKQLRETGVSVEREGDNINLIMPGNITFETNSDNLQASFNEILKSVAIVLEEYEKTIIAVSGHTDSTGSDSYNQKLSEQRAQSVANFLKAQNIADARFEVIGFGEKFPIADNSTPEGRAMNRRVELTLLPITEEMLQGEDA